MSIQQYEEGLEWNLSLPHVFMVSIQWSQFINGLAKRLCTRQSASQSVTVVFIVCVNQCIQSHQYQPKPYKSACVRSQN